MAENNRTPVAIRLVRPYETEDEFLLNELETVGKTSVILIGAHPRPTGVILRFEVTLASGHVVLRGEGRVLAHKENAFRGQPGLSLRFTRLDPKSKALVDRATAIREAKAAGDPEPMSARAPASAKAAPASAPIPPAETPPPSAETRWKAEAPTATGDDAVADALTETPAPPPRAPVRRRMASSRPAPPVDPGPASSGQESLKLEPASAPASAGHESLKLEPASTPASWGHESRRLEPPVSEAEIGVLSSPEPSVPAASIAGAAETVEPEAPAERSEAPVTDREAEPAMSSPEPSPIQVAVALSPPAVSGRTVDAPADKDALLERLRERRRALPPERVAEILSPRS